ncbi:TolC family protein [Caldimonas sp. KR1-144]|uniref:TolC family protein n=1 Tax=Caldimonas sp. KR1-144 TaxID=3400911 RepID=UPI003C022902
MKPPLRVLALLAAAALAPGAHALDLVQAWAAAQQHAPDAAAALAARAAGSARGEQAQTLWRPSVVLEGGVSYAASETAARGAQFSAPGFGQTNGVNFDTSVTGGTGTRYALALRQPVYSRERSARSEALETSARAAEFEWTQARQALMLSTTEAYFGAALAAERLRLLQRQQQAVDQAATEARDRFRIGDRPVTDVHEAGARAAALQAERLAAQTQLQLQRNALADVTGLALNDEPLALPGERLLEGVGTLDDWLDRAARRNPGLMMAEAHVHVARAQARATSAALSPTLDVVAQLGYDRISGDGDFGRASHTGRNGAIGVQLSVPLYTGGTRSAVHAEDRALADKAQAELERARQRVAQQTRAAWLDLAVGASQTGALAAALEATRARLDATRVGLKAGDRTTLDLLNAENDATAAELALTEARVRLVTRHLQLAALAGELDDIALQRANARLQAPQRP